MNSNSDFVISGKITTQTINIIDIDTKKSYSICVEEDEIGQIYNLYVKYGETEEKTVYLSYPFNIERDASREDLPDILEQTIKITLDLLMKIILGETLTFITESEEIQIRNYRFF